MSGATSSPTNGLSNTPMRGHGDSDVTYLTAALSWYVGGPAGEDVTAAWDRILDRLGIEPAARSPDPAVAVLEAEVARLRRQIECLTSPDIFWGEDGEDFADGDYVDIWQGGVFQVSVGKLLGFRYAAYIPTEIDPETGAFDAGEVEYFPTEAEAIAAQDAAVKALNPAPSEKEAG